MKQIIFELSKGRKWSINIMQSDINLFIFWLIMNQPFQYLRVHSIKQLSTYRSYRKYKDFLKQYY